MEKSTTQEDDKPEDIYLAAEQAMNSNDRNSLSHALTMGRALLRKPGISILYAAKTKWLIANCILLLKHDTADGKECAEECLQLCDYMRKFSDLFNLDEIANIEQAARTTLSGLEATLEAWDGAHTVMKDGENEVRESVENDPEESQVMRKPELDVAGNQIPAPHFPKLAPNWIRKLVPKEDGEGFIYYNTVTQATQTAISLPEKDCSTHEGTGKDRNASNEAGELGGMKDTQKPPED